MFVVSLAVYNLAVYNLVVTRNLAVARSDTRPAQGRPA